MPGILQPKKISYKNGCDVWNILIRLSCRDSSGAERQLHRETNTETDLPTKGFTNRHPYIKTSDRRRDRQTDR